MLFENDQFLLELTKLFQQQRLKNTGSLCLTMKRYDGKTKPKPQLTKKQRLELKKNPTTTSSSNVPNTSTEIIEYKCLVRANYGSKKLSTIVSSKDINRFQLAYANLLKANMDTLKKKAKETKASSSTNAGQSGSASQVPSSPTTTLNQTKKPLSPLTKTQPPSSPTVSSNTPKKSGTPSKKK